MKALHKKITLFLVVLSFNINTILPAQMFNKTETRRLRALARELKNPDLQEELIEKMAEDMGVPPELLKKVIKIIARKAPNYPPKKEQSESFWEKHRTSIIITAVVIASLIYLNQPNEVERRLRSTEKDVRRLRNRMRTYSNDSTTKIEQRIDKLEQQKNAMQTARQAGCTHLNNNEDLIKEILEVQAHFKGMLARRRKGCWRRNPFKKESDYDTWWLYIQLGYVDEEDF